MINFANLTVLASPRNDLDSPMEWLALSIPLLIVALALANWSTVLVRRLSSQARQQRWLEKKFNGEDVVEIYSPATKITPYDMAMIAYRNGYVFARSHASSRDFNHTYVFRKLFDLSPASREVV